MSALAGAALWNARQAYEAQRIAESKAAEAASAQGKAEASAKITAEKTTLAEREKARADEEAARASLLAQEAAAARSDQLGVLAQAALRNGALPESLLLAVEAISNTLKASAPGSAAHLLTVDRVFYEAMVGLDATPNLFHGGRLYDVAFSPDNRMLATAGADNTIKLWSTTDPLAAPVVLTGHTGTVFDIEFGRNGSLLASAGADGLVGLWRMGDAPSLLRLLPGHTDGVARVAFSKDGNWLASASSDSTIRLWNVARLPVLNDAAILRGHRGRVAFVTFSPDSRHLASSGEDGIIWLWDMGDPGVAPLRFDKGASVASVAFSPDGARLAAGGADSSISIWQAANPKVSPQQLAGHSGGISSLTFSPDGQWLASADFQGTVILWAAQPSLSEIARRRHNAGVDYIAFSDKSEWLATTDRSGAVELVFMRAPRAEPIRVHGHNDFVFSADFSGDDHWLASAGFDGLVRLYPLDLADQVRMACATTGRNFTNEEWTRHFGAAPYHLTCAQWPVHDTIAQAARDKAVQLAMSGQLVEAAEQFRHYLQLAPEIALDPAVEAKRIYDEAQAQEFLTRGNALARALDVEGAIALFREAQHFDPALIQDAEAEANRIAAGQLVAQANQTAQTLDLPGVTALLEQAAALDPATVAAPAAEARRLVAAQTVSAATVLAANGNLDDAVHSYETALALGAELELEPRLAAQVAYGRGLLGRNAYLDALAALDTSLVISPSFNVTNSLIAAQWDSICHFGNLLDRAADVLPACGRAVALRADYADFHANHAIALALIDDLPGAISALERYLALAELTQSDDAAVLIARRGWLQALRAGVNPIRASILTRTGQYEAAAPIYAALWQLNPPILYTPDEMNNICWYGTLAGHAVDVLYMCDWALLLRPTTANYYDSRGLARAATGDLAGAAQDFDRYLYAGGTVPDVTRQRRQAWVIALRAGYNPVLAHIQVYNG
ncbi:MAG: hypothetical protein KAX65_13895, partial [Caldilineaceae bacterium]|nr:hypothetical protein [Caldilineaceae bacterium]